MLRSAIVTLWLMPSARLPIPLAQRVAFLLWLPRRPNDRLDETAAA